MELGMHGIKISAHVAIILSLNVTYTRVYSILAEQTGIKSCLYFLFQAY